MADLECLALEAVGQLTSLERMRGDGRGIRRPRHLGAKLVADMQPHAARLRAGRLAEQLRHPGQNVVHRVRAADPIGELGHHLVRRRALPYTSRSARRCARGRTKRNAPASSTPR